VTEVWKYPLGETRRKITAQRLPWITSTIFPPWNSYYLMKACEVPITENIPVWISFRKTSKSGKGQALQVNVMNAHKESSSHFSFATRWRQEVSIFLYSVDRASWGNCGFSTNLTHFFLFSMYLFLHLYMFQAKSAHHQEGKIVSTHSLV
jgi:hypothetical protein